MTSFAMLWRGLFSARYRYCRQAPRYPFYPIPTNSARLDNISNRIMSGEGFQQTPLPDSVPLLASAESRAVGNPLEMRGTAIIRLRLFEEATNPSDTRLADQRLKSLRSSVNRGSRSWLRADRGFFVVHPILERYQCRQSG
jgi:hypothetical protein